MMGLSKQSHSPGSPTASDNGNGETVEGATSLNDPSPRDALSGQGHAVLSNTRKTSGPERWLHAVAERIALARALFGVACYLLRLALTLRFSLFKTVMITEIRMWRARRQIRLSNVFDAEFYRAQFSKAPTDLVFHYLRHGVHEGRWPNPLFDGSWYLSHNGDVRTSGINPLLHYILTWQTEGRRVNAFFDPRWYLIANGDARKSGLDPITHYLRIGAQQGADPSPDFDTRWYLDQNGDVAAASSNPLVHFLHHGRREGRLPRLRASRLSDGKPVENAELHCLQFHPLGPEVSLFVTHSPDGRLKPHLRRYLEALADEGIDIALIIAADRPFRDDDDWLRPLVKCLFVRENSGLDFAAWAHILRRHPELNNAQALYLLNDSLIGPTNTEDFHALIARIRNSEADVVGLTENRERGWHIQSYFLVIKRAALSSFIFHQFVLNIVSFEDKDDVINNFEVQFAPVMIDAGLKVEALFRAVSIHNLTLFHWRELIDEGFPFIKVMTIRDVIDGVDNTGWAEALSEKGYDVSLAEALLDDLARQRESLPEKFIGSLVKQSTQLLRSPPRIGFLGPWNFDNGLGFAARGYASALMQTRFQTAILSVHRPFDIHSRIAPSIDYTDFDGGCDVAIVHLNPTAWNALLDERQLAFIAAAKCRVGLFVWESVTIPDYFIEGFNQVDRVWTPSRFCAEAFRAVTDKPIDVIPHVVEPVSSIATKRRLAQLRDKLGLVEGDRVILYIFDASSYLARKNPSALVRAFDDSRLARNGWRLILKTKNLNISKPDAIELVTLVRERNGIVLFAENMSSAELSALLDLADIYASSHSSEGFGLTIAEALARGKPVVATDYGGSRDFLNEETGFPVRCHEALLGKDEGAYGGGTVWGVIDEDHLASSLVSAATLTDSQLDTFREAAQRVVAENLSSSVVAARIEASLERALASCRGGGGS